MTLPALPDPPEIQRREAILAAALRLIAHSGLHNTPMSAIAREAGVAVGTLYIYFESKDALINTLYLELVDDRERASGSDADSMLAPGERFWRFWSSLARWHLDHRDAANFIQQCEASGILSEATRALVLEARAAGMAHYMASVRDGLLRDLPVEVCYALYMGPILILAHMQDKHEIDVTEELLELTFDGVGRSVLAPGAVRNGVSRESTRRG